MLLYAICTHIDLHNIVVPISRTALLITKTCIVTTAQYVLNPPVKLMCQLFNFKLNPLLAKLKITMGTGYSVSCFEATNDITRRKL